MPKECTTYRLLCEMASFLKFNKGVTILLLDPVLTIYLNISTSDEIYAHMSYLWKTTCNHVISTK